MDGSNASLLLTPMASRSHTNAAGTDTTNRRHPDGTWGFASVQLPEECLTVASSVGSEGISPTAYPHAATVPPTPSFDTNTVEEEGMSKESGGGGGPSLSLKSLLVQYDAAFSGLYPYLSRSQPSPLSYPLTHPSTINNNSEQFTNHQSEAAAASSRTSSSQQTTLLPPWRPSMMKRSWNTLLVVMLLLSLTAALVLHEATSAQAVRRDAYYMQQAYLYARRRHFEPYYVASKSRNALGGGISAAAVVVDGDDDFPAMRDPTIQRYVGKRNKEDAKLFVKYVNAACSKYGDDDGGHGDDGGVGNGHSLPAYMSPLYPNKSVDGDHWAYFAFCFIAGILSALPSLAVTPVDIVKCRLQVGVYTEGFLRGMRDLCKEGLLDGLSAVHSFQSSLQVAAAAGGHNDGLGGIGGGAVRSLSSAFHVEHSSREDGEEVVDEGGGKRRGGIRPQSKWFVIRLAVSLGRWLVRSLGVLFVTGPCDVQGFRNVLSNKFAILGRCGLRTPSLSPPVVVGSNSQWFLPLRTVHFLLTIKSSGPNTTTLRAALADDILHAILVGMRLMLLLQGFLLAVFAGWQPVCVGYSLQGSIKYGFYEFGKFKLGRILGDEFVIEHHLIIFLVSAMVAELSADLLLAPWESIKIRLQMAKRRFSFRVSFPVILHVEGIHELYRCLGPVMCRQVPVTSVKFVSYESIVRFFVERLNALDHLSEVQVALVAGCTAGVICAILTQPADTLVSQVSQLRASGGSDTSVLTLIKRLGVRKLYGGMVPRLVMVAMLTALQWGIYDGFKHFVGLPTTGSR